jgi:hypothetical protein
MMQRALRQFLDEHLHPRRFCGGNRASFMVSDTVLLDLYQEPPELGSGLARGISVMAEAEHVRHGGLPFLGDMTLAGELDAAVLRNSGEKIVWKWEFDTLGETQTVRFTGRKR